MIKTINLTKKYGDFTAVNNLCLEIYKGELFSLLGINGAGKTTTIKMLTTITTPTSGEIYFNGENVNKNPEKIKSKMNLSPQETAIAPNLSVKENLTFIAGVYQILNKAQKVNELIELFNLKEFENKKASTLSGGLKRRLSIAMALINEPEILFLDEPTLGLDVIARRELWNIIKKLKGKTTIILTTHYMEEAESLSDRVGIMAKGEIKFLGKVEEAISLSNEKDFENAFIKRATEGEL
ncbi:MAG: ABC transporter ATP-binding protein [Clostridia bacterium]|nr:ABC transporter ATP-binding protein [Clostridia bacterium]